MCGIGGFVNFDSSVLLSGDIYNLLESLKKRGPEGTSWLELDYENKFRWISEKKKFNKERKIKLALGCSRLAINDFSDRGLQPLSDNYKKIWVVLNGEIFNFIELKNELIKYNYEFLTNTDTEIIVNAYKEWGINCVKKFNGQFAISILDLEKKKFFFVRDRLGIIPIYYFFNNKQFIFSTEINSILFCKKKPFTLNDSQVLAIASLPYKLHNRSEQTLVKNIFSVNKSGIIELDLKAKKITKHKYWNIKKIKKKKISVLDAKNKLKDLIIDSVKIRLRTDRNIAFIVSGGIDSSSVIGIAKKEFNINPSAYSLDLPDERFNEKEEISLVVNNLSIKNKLLSCDKVIFFEHINKVLNNMDQPLPTPNAILHNYMAEKIENDGFKVVLNGVGGDEVFFGYHDHFLYNLYSLKKKNSSKFKQELYSWEKYHGKTKDKLKEFISFAEDKSLKFSPDFLARSGQYDYRKIIKFNQKIRSYLCKNLDFSVRSKQIEDLSNFVLPHSIKMDDNCYFSNAIESRQPFLDHRLVEFGISLHEELLMKKGFGKFILRQAVKKYIPKRICNNRKKIGLNYPVDKWMKRDIKVWVEENLANKNNPIFNFSDFSIVRDILKEHYKSTHNHSLKIWDLCILNQWLTKNKRHLQL